MNKTVSTPDELNLAIATEVGVALNFSSISCSVCHVLGPKIKNMIKNEFPLIRYIDISVDLFPKIASSQGVYTAPTLLVFLEGKEFIRICGNMGIHQLKEKIKRPYNILNS